MKYSLYTLAIIIITSASCVLAIDNPHFYRATNMFLEPRLEHDYLTTFAATIGGGSTDKGRNACNEIVPIFDIYGPNIVPAFGANANLSLQGTFKIIEANLSFAQNLAHGFFFFFHLPVRSLTFKNICTNLPFDTFTSLLKPFGINAQPQTSNGVGDLTSWIGWTHNYQETETIDFIDSTVMTGFLAPTGKLRNEHSLFSLPTGYNGHWGVPLCGMVSIGFYEWVTIGAYINTLFFAHRNRVLRLKTDPEQSGFITLTPGEVSVHKGPLINTGLYFKADHVGHGFSFTAAYSFASQRPSCLIPKNPALFNPTIINSDPALKNWTMHTMNFLLEYDFAKEDSKVGNRIGVFYNLQFAGKRTFNTNVAGGTYGIDIGWYM